MEVDNSHGTLINKSEENDFEKKGTSDPVVYQLVRVEGDGTLVPATEDDVLQFEHFLHNDEKVDLPSIEDVGHVEEFFNNDCMLLKKPDLEDGSSKLETVEVHTQKLGADLEENRLQSLDDSLSPPSECRVIHSQHSDKLLTEQGDNVTRQDNASTETTKSTVLNESCSAEKDKADACSRPVCDTSTDPSVSGVNSSMPDFSILRGEVCLDDLTIRELQRRTATSSPRTPPSCGTRTTTKRAAAMCSAATRGSLSLRTRRLWLRRQPEQNSLSDPIVSEL